MGQALSLEVAEHRMLEMGIESWRSGLVGATADCKIATFDVPIGSGVHVPSRKGDADSENGTVPLADSLHIHTAKCTPIGAGDDLSEPRVTPKTWDVDQQELKASDGVPVLLMHGYGSGIAIYSAMLPGMAAQYGGAVYAIDTLGCGLSSRPAADGHWTDLTVRQSEDFFVAGIERWRQAMGFDKVNLVGHSIGGYLAVTYAERYPAHVDQVVTIGCAGLIGVPDGFEDNLRASFPMLAPIVINVWSRGISPFNIMRWGPGHLFFRKYAGRYKALPWFTEIGRFKDYLHSNWTGNHVSAGGYAHITLLAAAGFAHEPLRHRVPHLTQTKSLRMIYGEKDWMDPTHGFALRDELVAASSSPTDPLRVEVATVLQGGHNIVLENPTGTIEALLAALGDATFNDGVYTGLWSPPPPIVVDLATPA